MAPAQRKPAGAQRALHSCDTLSYTVAGKPWVNFEWLSELPYYFAYMWLGLSGLYVTMMLLATAIILGIYRLALLRSQDTVAAFVAAFVAVLFATVSLAPRTLLFGWLCLVVELGILWGLGRGATTQRGCRCFFCCGSTCMGRGSSDLG